MPRGVRPSAGCNISSLAVYYFPARRIPRRIRIHIQKYFLNLVVLFIILYCTNVDPSHVNSILSFDIITLKLAERIPTRIPACALISVLVFYRSIFGIPNAYLNFERFIKKT